jgi:biotin carboxyl carrier protein
MFTVTIQEKTYTVEKINQQPYVDGKPIDWDLQWITDRHVHLIAAGRSIEAELIQFDPESKTIQIKFENKTVSLEVRDKFDLLLEKLGMNTSASNAVKDIKAPMPGLILDIKVKAGDVVKKGDVVLILEAMKMENSIKAPGDGIVKGIKVNLKDSVEKNQVLIQF